MTEAVVLHAVNMTDVDLVQVNFARFFVWTDVGYNTLLREAGHPLSGVVHGGHATPVVDASCRYFSPVNLDDSFAVRTAVVSAGRTSFTVAHRFEIAGKVFALAKLTHVWIRAQPPQAPEPLPDWIRELVNPSFESDISVPS